MCHKVLLCLLLGMLPAVASAAQVDGTDPPAVAPVPIELPSALLKSVTLEDNRPGLQEEEFDAYYEILDRARRVDPERLRAAAREFLLERRAAYPKWQDKPIEEFPTFVDLFRNPKLYHGKPVTLSGHARKHSWYPADAEGSDIKMLHEVWLFTEHSQANPVVVVCTSVPDDFPTEAELIEHVSITGYFFKMYVYQAEDAFRVAPMVLASRLHWRPVPESQLLGPLPAWGYAVVAGVLACVVFGLWRLARKDRTARSTYTHGDADAENVDLRGLAIDDRLPDDRQGP